MIKRYKLLCNNQLHVNLAMKKMSFMEKFLLKKMNILFNK